MKCSNCGNDKIIVNSTLESEEGTTEVTAIHTLMCTNAGCKMFKQEEKVRIKAN